jgi:hypothetical protein
VIVQKNTKYYEYRSLRTDEGKVKTYYIGTMSLQEVHQYQKKQQQRAQQRRWFGLLTQTASAVREETATIRRLVTLLLPQEGWTLRRGELRRLPSTNPQKKGEKRPVPQPMMKPGDTRTVINNTTYRELEDMTNLQAYLPLPSTLQSGIFHTLFVYLSDGQDSQAHIRRYQTLWETLLTQNQAGLVGTLLVKEIILSALLLEVAQKKLNKFWSLKEAKMVDTLAHRYQKALSLYQKTQKIAAS